MGLQLGFERLGQHVARLRQRAFGRIHQQHHAVHHLERALHLAAKIGVARRVDNVDLAAVKVDGRVLGQDGDAALPLQFVRVHHPLGHLLVGAEGAGLAQHGVNEGGLAVVNMGNDGDIAYRLGHRYSFSFSRVRPRRAVRLGDKIRNNWPRGAANSILAAARCTFRMMGYELDFDETLLREVLLLCTPSRWARWRTPLPS